MAKIMNGNRVVTNEVRLSYANVFTPKSINGGDEKYSVSLIIPKSDTEAIDQAITDGVSKFGGKKPNKAALKLPLRDGIEKDDEAYEDAYFINCNSKTAPQIVDLNRQPITDETEVYSAMQESASTFMPSTQMAIRVSHVDLEISRRPEMVRALVVAEFLLTMTLAMVRTISSVNNN